MLDDIAEIDVKILTKAVNEGMREAKKNTNVITGHLRKSWRSAPAVKSASGEVKKALVNSADYALFVNNGHRIVNDEGETVRFVTGQFILEKAIITAEKAMKQEYSKEIERVKREHDM